MKLFNFCENDSGRWLFEGKLSGVINSVIANPFKKYRPWIEWRVLVDRMRLGFTKKHMSKICFSKCLPNSPLCCTEFSNMQFRIYNICFMMVCQESWLILRTWTIDCTIVLLSEDFDCLMERLRFTCGRYFMNWVLLRCHMNCNAPFPFFIKNVIKIKNPFSFDWMELIQGSIFISSVLRWTAFTVWE